MPFAIKKFGIELYGNFSFLLALAVFFSFCLDLSLNTAGVQYLSKLNDVVEKKSFVKSLVLSKLSILLVALSLVFFAYDSFFSSEKLVSIVSFVLISVGLSLTNLWYYISLGSFKSIISISLFFKFSSLIVLYSLVDKFDDFLYLQAGTFFFIGLVSFFHIIKKNIDGNFDTYFLVSYVRETRHMYTYSIVSGTIQPFINYTLYSSGDGVALGVYSVTNRFLIAAVNLSSAINNSLNPLVSKYFYNTESDAFKVRFFKILSSLFIYSFIVSVLVFVASAYSVSRLANQPLTPYVLFFIGVVSIATLPSIVNQFLTQTLHLFGKSKRIRNYVLFSSMFSLSVVYLKIGMDLFTIVMLGVSLTPILILCLLLWELKCINWRW